MKLIKNLKQIISIDSIVLEEHSSGSLIIYPVKYLRMVICLSTETLNFNIDK